MRQAIERSFVTHDGVELFYRYWPRTTPGIAERTIVLLHRGHEHSGRLQHVVDELDLDDYAMFAWDQRGHGRSPGARGDSPSFGVLIKDVDAFVRHIGATFDIAPTNIAVIGQSMAAVLAVAWAHDFAPPVRCLVLTAPAFKVKLYVPFARSGLAFLHRIAGNFFVKSYVKAKFLTQDPDRIRSYDTDPLIARSISVRILLGLFETAKRVIADAQAIQQPVLLLTSDTDWVVHREPQDEFFARLGSPVKEKHVLPGFLHDTLGERDRKLALDKVRDFLERIFVTDWCRPSLRNAHRSGYTFEEELKLRTPLPALSFANLMFGAQRTAMNTLGRLADGIRLGLATGFDSGASLDYVYRNEATGRLGIGRLIDRGYLDAIGWRGIRIRKQHIELAIGKAAEALASDRLPVRILDIAAGHGRYVLDAIDSLGITPDAVLLRDYVESNVLAGRSLIEARGLQGVARFEHGDAFHAGSLTRIMPVPTIAITAGLYELYSDNDDVLRSLNGVSQALQCGGFLLYTGQPVHPQLEMIARTLTSHRDHKPWIMRRRTQAELDELVAIAGFTKVEQWVDEWGMFTVSLARKT